MNRLDQSLQRLFKAAARAREDAPESLPGHLETRILAQWRSARRGLVPDLWSVMLPRGLLGACAIALACAVWTLRSGAGDSAYDVTSMGAVVQESETQ
jgi:hypothetical protein